MKDTRITSKQRLEHIVESISVIEGFIKEHSKESFLNNSILVNAVLFQFAIIGEAIIHVDYEVLDKYSYPWYKVRAFRNFIIHEYHAIEFRIIWESAKKDLPELKEMVLTILNTEF
jgi:uncharacterized protein with HEPN domain